MKFGVCAILKNENLYLREWVEHYINLGFDKIILYDNNDINGEIPNVVIQDYIDKNYVDIINWKYKTNGFAEFNTMQMNAYNDCLDKYKNELDWIAFLDIDEFLHLTKHKKIQYVFEAYNNYKEFDIILMSWCTMGNKNELYYKTENVQDRFTEHTPGKYGILENIDLMIKSFVKTSSNAKYKVNVHSPETESACNIYGIRCYGCKNCTSLDFYNHDIMYVKHYYTKSLCEFLYKSYNKSNFTFGRSIDQYKLLNGWSEEHEKVYQKFLKDNNIEAPE